MEWQQEDAHNGFTLYSEDFAGCVSITFRQGGGVLWEVYQQGKGLDGYKWGVETTIDKATGRAKAEVRELMEAK